MHAVTPIEWVHATPDYMHARISGNNSPNSTCSRVAGFVITPSRTVTSICSLSEIFPLFLPEITRPTGSSNASKGIEHHTPLQTSRARRLRPLYLKSQHKLCLYLCLHDCIFVLLSTHMHFRQLPLGNGTHIVSIILLFQKTTPCVSHKASAFLFS